MPNGAVVLPGLDRELDDDSWAELDAGHRAIRHEAIARAASESRARDVRDWRRYRRNHSARWLLREALATRADDGRVARSRRPRQRDDCRRASTVCRSIEAGTSGRRSARASRSSCVRHSKRRAQTAALVTPDRNLARRVAAELRRWDIAIDNSAGRPLAAHAARRISLAARRCGRQRNSRRCRCSRC